MFIKSWIKHIHKKCKGNAKYLAGGSLGRPETSPISCASPDTYVAITRKQLVKKLKAHKKWLTGKGGRRLILDHIRFPKCHLQNEDFSLADLRTVDFSATAFTHCQFNQAKLRDCNGDDCYFDNCDFSNAIIGYSSFTKTRLVDIAFNYAEIFWTNFRFTALRGVLFHGSCLSLVDFSHSTQVGVRFEHANIQVVTTDNKYVYGKMLTEPIIGYKKCISQPTSSKKPGKPVIVKLEIPKNAIVFSINGTKCRTNVAKVLEIDDGNCNTAFAIRNSGQPIFTYKVGKTVHPVGKEFDCQYNVECSTGIHFFLTREAAEAYEY